jgi:hypothetical protein
MHPHLGNQRNIGAGQLPVSETAAHGDIGICLRRRRPECAQATFEPGLR